MAVMKRNFKAQNIMKEPREEKKVIECNPHIFIHSTQK